MTFSSLPFQPLPGANFKLVSSRPRKIAALRGFGGTTSITGNTMPQLLTGGVAEGSSNLAAIPR